MNEHKLNWYNCIEPMNLQRQAEQFRAAYEVQNGPDLEQMQLRLINEEHREFIEAQEKLETYEGAAADCLKELADLVYVCFQYAANREWDLIEAMHRVHASNMSKLGPDGKPIRREDGKVLKGPNYKPPYLEDITSTDHTFHYES